MRKSKFTRVLAAVIIACLLLTLCAVFAFASGSAAEDEMADIKNDFAAYLVQDTRRVADDGYVGALEYTIYYDYATFGKSQGGFDGVNAIVYCVNTNTERVGTESNKTIIQSMLDRGYLVVVVDYLNNPNATGHALDDSAQIASQRVKFGDWIDESSKISDVAGWSTRYFKTYVCPSGHNVLLDSVFFEIDKHSASGTLEKVVENWNTDFKTARGENSVKWAYGDDVSTRKTVAKAADGSSPVWYNASGAVDANGLYTKVKYTVANTITDCVNPDGSALDLDLKIQVVYPTSPEKEVPVLSVSCAWGYATATEQCYTDLCSHHSGALFRGYAGAVYEYMWQPMAQDSAFGYYDGSQGVTKDHMNYSVHLYNDKLVNTASQRFLRYLALSDSDTYRFDLDKFSCIGLSKGGWFTFLGDAELQSGLVDNPTQYTEAELEAKIDEALSAFTPRRYFDGHHGETRYQAGEGVITGGAYVGEDAIDAGEIQPWLTYNGEEIISGVQLTYASNGSQQEDIAEGHVPMFIAAHMNDEYNAAYGSANDSILAAESMNVPLIYFEVDQLHEFAYTPDMFYNVSTYDAFFDFAGFYLKGEPVKVFYTDPYDGDGRISITDKIEIQFSGEVSLSEVEKISITASNESLDGTWISSCGGTKWIFVPYAMSGDTAYTITVPAGFKGVNGVATADAYTAGFVTEADDATKLVASEGSYYTVTAPTSMPSGKDTVVFRFAVTNDASNVAELYAVDGVSATDGTLIGKVNLKGAGIYEIDITEYALKNAGQSLTFFLKAGKDAGQSVVKELDFSSKTDLATKGQAPLEIVMIDENGNKVAEGGDSVAAIYINPRTYNAGDVNYENITAALGVDKLFGTSDKVTDADYGRRFTVTLKFFDTASRTVQLRLGHMTSSSLGVMDTKAPYINIRTTAGEWVEYSFDYVVYDTEYGAGSNVTKALYINVSPTGDTKKEIYISHLKVTETVTDMTVTNAELAYKTLGKVVYKAPEADKPFALYNGENPVGTYDSFKSAMGAYANGYTLKLTDNYVLADADLYSDFGTKAKNIVIDLNGYTIYSENTKNSLLWLKNTSTAIEKTAVTLKNGGVVLSARPLISFEDSTSAGAGKTFDIKLENLKITLDTERASVTELISASSIKDGATTEANITLDECDINIGDEDKRAVVMLNLFPEGKGALKLSYDVIGGSISMSHPRWITIISNSFYSSYYRGENGYTKLYLPSAYSPSEKVSFISDAGYSSFIANATVNNVTEYEIKAGAGSTLYGVIPDAYLDFNTYHFAVFKDGAFIGAYRTWKDATTWAQDAVDGAKHIGTQAQIVLLSDYTNKNDVGAVIKTATDILFDLNGKTFTCDAVGVDFTGDYANAPYATSFTVRNGTVLIAGNAFFDSQFFGEQAGVKTFNVLCDGVTFGFSPDMTSSGGAMIHVCWGSPSGSTVMEENFTFRNCTIDLRNYKLAASKRMTVFEASKALYKMNVTFEGGAIIQGSLQNISFFSVDNGDTVSMKKNADGKYMTLTVEGGNAPIDMSFRTPDGDILKFKETSTAGFYELDKDELASDYGIIPTQYSSANDYPFAVFRDGEFYGAYGTWNTATNAAQNAVNGASYLNSTAVILLRRDFASPKGDSGAIINKATNLVLDLGKHTFTYGDVGIDLSGKYNDAPYKTSVNVKNGTVLNTCGMGFADVQHNSGSATKEFDLKFEGVTFGFASNIDSTWSNWGQSIMLIEMWGTNAGAGSLTSVEYNDCVFNLRDNVPSAITASNKIQIFQVNDSTNNANVNITVKGGSFLANDLKLYNFFNGSSNDSLTFTKGTDGYATLTTPATKSYTNGIQYTGSFNTPEGVMYFVEMQDDGVNSVCVLDKIDFGYGAVDISTNDKHLSAVDFPYVVLMDNSFKGGYGAWHQALNRANELAAMSENAGKTVYIAQRRDYSSTQGTGYTSARGKIVADLRGFTLTCADKYLVDIYVNYGDSTGLGYTSTLEIKNGTLKNQRANAPMIAIGHTGTNANYDTKQFNMIFNGVTFKLAGDGATIIKEWTGGTHVGDGVNTNYLIDGCTVDISGAKAGSVLFDLQNAVNGISVVFRGGKIISDDLSAVTLCAVNGDDSYYFEAVSGVYTSLSQPSHIAVPNSRFKNQQGKVLSFLLDKNNGLYSDYTLGEPISTTYGDIPYQYNSAESYPFAVFDENGNFLGAFESLLDITDPYNNNGAINCAKNYLSANTYNGSSYGASERAAFIILRRDYKFASNESYNNLAQVQGVITIDLMDYTLTAADNKVMFPSSIKPWVVAGDASIFPTEFYFKNGNIEIVNAAMINFESWKGGDNIDVSGKEFIYRFDGIDFAVIGSASNIFATTSLSGTPEATGYPELIFNDCSIDITRAAQGATLFNLGNGLTNVKVTVAGGRIIADAKAFNIFAKSDATTSELVFLRGKDGKYTELVIPAGVAAPAGEYYGFKFAKTANEGENEIYTLVPMSVLQPDFKPLASITLDSNLIFNIYIPDDNRITAVTLDGKTVELGTAKDGYYLVSTELSADEGAKILTLVVALNIDGISVNGTFTFSTVKYTEKLLTMDSVTETEKTLAKDMLAYVKSAYSYFDSADKATIAEEINAVIGNYDKAFSKVEGAGADDSNILAGVTFVLDSTPAIRFYLPEGASLDGYSFKIGNTALEIADSGIETAGDCAGLTYADISLYAYRMIETITIANGANTATYHINEYYDGMDKSDTALVDIVEKFYNYCVSANAYKRLTVNN